jgi:E3 ubiquitin-protein ligase HERC2
MALTSSGDVYLWGTLPGTGTTHLVPQKLDVALFKHSSPDSGVRSICAGPQSAAVVRSDGRLYTWGYGGSRLASLFGGGAGTLGHAAPLGNRRTPEFVAGLEHEDVVSVSLGHAHAAAVLSSGEAFVWGTGNWGRLGLGTSYSTRTPAYMLSLRGTPMADIQCGHTHSLGLGRDGSVWAWGKNDHFQLGAESSGTYFGGAGFDAHNVPTPLPFFADKPCSGVLASHYWSGAVTADGRAYLWGNRQMLAPTRIVLGRENEAAVGMSAGPMHVAVLGRSGRVYLLGRNGHGELGVARRGTRKEFVLAESVGFPVAAVACGGGFTMVVEQQGQTEGKTEAKTRERESVGESESGGEQAKSSEGAPENK